MRTTEIYLYPDNTESHRIRALRIRRADGRERRGVLLLTREEARDLATRDDARITEVRGPRKDPIAVRTYADAHALAGLDNPRCDITFTFTPC